MTNWCMDQRMESVYLHAKGRREKRGRISVTFRGASAFFRLCLMGGVASHSQSGANELKSLSALIIRVGLRLSPARFTCCPGPLRMNHSECSMNVHVARIIMASSRTHVAASRTGLPVPWYKQSRSRSHTSSETLCSLWPVAPLIFSCFSALSSGCFLIKLLLVVSWSKRNTIHAEHPDAWPIMPIHTHEVPWFRCGRTVPSHPLSPSLSLGGLFLVPVHGNCGERARPGRLSDGKL